MSFFACCFRRHNRYSTSSKIILEPPEITWDNTLGSPNGIPFDDATKDLLRGCLDVKTPAPVTLTEIIKRSQDFPVNFPVSSVRCKALRDRGIGMDTLELNANSAYPLMHEATLPLVANWLKHKRIYGTDIEKTLYKDMGLVQFVQRLLEKRAMQFYGPDDRFTLISGKSGTGGWENVGTEHEKDPLVLASCLSYDEMKISATIINSSHSEFINDGSRENRGIVCDDPDSIQPRGVIMCVVGTRFEKPRVMEYQDILISHSQNNVDNGYGPRSDNVNEEKYGMRCIWSRFYGEDYHPLYEDAVKKAKSKENLRYLPLTGHVIFDVENYMKRTLMSVEMILLEANTRAENQNTTAFLHVVGFGLGVWKIMHNQEVYFLKTFEIALRKMNKTLKYVSDIMFSYFRQQKCGGAGNGDYLGDIRIHFAVREPQTKLFRSSDANKLLIVTYVADANAYPGNEFWGNYLTSSGGPAAACSSQISELHNPKINSRMNGSNLHVASPEHGILHIGDYAKLHLTPLGSDQQARRPSRSPRNQRSRSADIDCLKKYMERRVEVRRHTETSETNHWLPFPQRYLRTSIPTKDQLGAYINTRASHGSIISIGNKEGHVYYNPTAEKTSPRRNTFDESYQAPVSEAGKIKWLPILARSTNLRSDSIPEDDTVQITTRASSGRSLSADVGILRRDSSSRWNEKCINFSDPNRLLSYKWMPETGIPMSRYIPSPLAVRRTSDGDKRKLSTAGGSGTARWVNYAKYPSPSPMQRKLSDKRLSVSEQQLEAPRKSSLNTRDNQQQKEESDQQSQEDQQQQNQQKFNEDEFAGCRPVRKFSSTVGDGRQKSDSQGDQDDSRIKQRLRELYDFKIETECPKRVRKPSWISKSSSEDDKSHQQESPLLTFRLKSEKLKKQDSDPKKCSDADHQGTKTRKLSERPLPRRDSSNDTVFEHPSEPDQPLLKWGDVLRASEERTKNEDQLASRAREKRTYSDDYENPCRRKYEHSSVRDRKRYSDSSLKTNERDEKRYMETNFRVDDRECRRHSNVGRNEEFGRKQHLDAELSKHYSSPGSRRGERGRTRYSNFKVDEHESKRYFDPDSRTNEHSAQQYSAADRPGSKQYLSMVEKADFKRCFNYSLRIPRPSHRELTRQSRILSDASYYPSPVLRRASLEARRTRMPNEVFTSCYSSPVRNQRINVELRQTHLANEATVNTSSYYTPLAGKRGSVEFKSGTRRIEVSHRRSLSQHSARPRMTLNHLDTRPAVRVEAKPRTPVPPPEIEDLYSEFRTGRNSELTAWQRKNSSRYKVYLT